MNNEENETITSAEPEEIEDSEEKSFPEILNEELDWYRDNETPDAYQLILTVILHGLGENELLPCPARLREDGTVGLMSVKTDAGENFYVVETRLSESAGRFPMSAGIRFTRLLELIYSEDDIDGIVINPYEDNIRIRKYFLDQVILASRTCQEGPDGDDTSDDDLDENPEPDEPSPAEPDESSPEDDEIFYFIDEYKILGKSDRDRTRYSVWSRRLGWCSDDDDDALIREYAEGFDPSKPKGDPERHGSARIMSKIRCISRADAEAWMNRVVSETGTAE